MKTDLSCDLDIPWAPKNGKCCETCLVWDALIMKHKNNNRDGVDEQKLPHLLKHLPPLHVAHTDVLTKKEHWVRCVHTEIVYFLLRKNSNFLLVVSAHTGGCHGGKDKNDPAVEVVCCQQICQVAPPFSQEAPWSKVLLVLKGYPVLKVLWRNKPFNVCRQRGRIPSYRKR